MRLWHEKLIPKLPQKQLCGQWRECIALLGNGWAKKHRTVDYVFNYSDKKLIEYTTKVMQEMRNRGYHPSYKTLVTALRKRHTNWETIHLIVEADYNTNNIYPEHNQAYYNECIENLKEKGINIKWIKLLRNIK